MTGQKIEYIDYDAIVEKVDVANSTVTVRLKDPESIAGMKTADKVIIRTARAAGYKAGQTVEVRQYLRLHRNALSALTVAICAILIAAMIAAFLLTGSQSTAVISGLGVMMFSFAFISMMRGRLPHEMTFEIIEVV
ncbi:MAG: SoxR reducing system RseC family protein [Muribaculum sp.]|nr:SoxR reducing system RseC family protein [Muribaculum sp.]